MAEKTQEFSDFVAHPRYGRRPRLTSLDAKIPYSEKFVLQSRCSSWSYYPNTAIKADMERQRGYAYYVKYYFDEKKQCTDCNRPFIFFAEEQKFWFDTLGISLHVRGHRCYDCRKIQTELKYNSKRYAELLQMKNRSINENKEMAIVCLTLMECGQFNPRQAQTIRMLMNSLRRVKSAKTEKFVDNIHTRLEAFENLVERLRTKVKAELPGIPSGTNRLKIQRFYRLAKKLNDHALQERIKNFD